MQTIIDGFRTAQGFFETYRLETQIFFLWVLLIGTIYFSIKYITSLSEVCTKVTATALKMDAELRVLKGLPPLPEPPTEPPKKQPFRLFF